LEVDIFSLFWCIIVEVAGVFAEVSRNPAAILKYQGEALIFVTFATIPEIKIMAKIGRLCI